MATKRKQATPGVPVVHDGLGGTAFGFEWPNTHGEDGGRYDNMPNMNPLDVGPLVEDVTPDDGS